MSEKEIPVEEAMTRLETLVTQMEEGELPLEKLLAQYEEGVRLVKLCQDRLDAAEQKIQVIKRHAGAPAGVEAFSPEDNE